MSASVNSFCSTTQSSWPRLLATQRTIKTLLMFWPPHCSWSFTTNFPKRFIKTLNFCSQNWQGSNAESFKHWQHKQKHPLRCFFYILRLDILTTFLSRMISSISGVSVLCSLSIASVTKHPSNQNSLTFSLPLPRITAGPSSRWRRPFLVQRWTWLSTTHFSFSKLCSTTVVDPC